MISEKLFAFLILVFGTQFAFRNLSELRREHFIDEENIDFLLMVSFLFILISVLMWPGRILSLGLSVVFVVLGFRLCLFFYMHRREKLFHSEFRMFLDRVILQMKSGFAFRHAMQIALEPCDAFVQQKIRKIIEMISFSSRTPAQNWNSQLQEILGEFQEVDRQSHRALHKLESYREKLFIVDDFRRKSGQAVRQARVQSILMAVLYLALLIYVLLNFSIDENSAIIFISVTFFVTGIFWIHFKQRKSKWNI